MEGNTERQRDTERERESERERERNCLIMFEWYIETERKMIIFKIINI